MSTFEIKRYSYPKVPTPGTCAACTHFSKGKRKKIGYCMKLSSSCRADSTCGFYRENPTKARR